MRKKDDIIIPIVIRGNSPFIKISINGTELTFLVDSGAGLSVYDKKFIELLCISEDQLGEAITDISGVGNNSFAGHMVMIFFGIGDKRFANQFTVTDLGETFRAFKESFGEVAGIMGGDFLFNYKAVIDYGECEMRIDNAQISSVMHAVMENVKG